RHEGPNSVLARALGPDTKTLGSVAGYVIGILLSPFVPLVSLGIYALVALAWFVPDRRIEKALRAE
ncbi:MAG TPA: hypothetical protein VGI89_04825, partial [Rhizomicrobium sp.]